MIRLLVIIAVVGFLTAVVTIGGAAALGGRDLAANGWVWDGWEPDRDRSGWGPRAAEGAGFEAATLDLAWDGSETLELGVPADVVFTQGGEGPGQLTVTGPRQVINRLSLEGGRLSDGLNHRPGRLKILMTAPKVTRFELNGSDRLTIGGYRQDSLEIHTSGSAAVTAQGETKALKLVMSGWGEADLGDLAADTADVNMGGSAKATLAPRTRATLDISGSGQVTLKTRPGQLEKNLSGSARVVEAALD